MLLKRQTLSASRSGMLTEQPGLYQRMSGLEYLLFYGRSVRIE